MKKAILILGGLAGLGALIYFSRKNQGASMLPGASSSSQAALTSSSTSNLDYFRSHKWVVLAPNAPGFDGSPFPSTAFVREAGEGVLWNAAGDSYGVIESANSIGVYNADGNYLAYRAILVS